MAHDRICLGAGNDRAEGGPGNDRVSGDEGNDELLGGDGPDVLTGGAGNDLLNGGSGADTLGGGSGDDYLLGGGGSDTANGDAGLDLMLGGAGNDRLDGGADLDTLSFASSPAGVTVNLTASLTFGTATGEGSDQVRRLEAVFGSAGDDTLNGSTLDDYLFGGGGDDQLLGSDGYDYLQQARAATTTFTPARVSWDQLEGGPGDDLYDGNEDTSPTAFFVGAPGPVTVDLGAGNGLRRRSGRPGRCHGGRSA